MPPNIAQWWKSVTCNGQRSVAFQRVVIFREDSTVFARASLPPRQMMGDCRPAFGTRTFEQPFFFCSWQLNTCPNAPRCMFPKKGTNIHNWKDPGFVSGTNFMSSENNTTRADTSYPTDSIERRMTCWDTPVTVVVRHCRSPAAFEARALVNACLNSKYAWGQHMVLFSWPLDTVACKVCSQLFTWTWLRETKGFGGLSVATVPISSRGNG